MVQAERHKRHLMGIAEVVHHMAEEEVREVHHSHQPQPDSAEVEDIVGINLAGILPLRWIGILRRVLTLSGVLTR
jgi:hypothetical protein